MKVEIYLRQTRLRQISGILRKTALRPY